jgi:glycosyltransferase involved in cell wall biosynthesis
MFWDLFCGQNYMDAKPRMNEKADDPVSVIISAYNEAETIEREIRAYHDVVVSRIPGSELIVAEDGSTDGTKQIISRLINELNIIHSTAAVRKGYALALRDAVNLAKCPYIFLSDAGNKHNPEDFWRLFPFREEFGLVIGMKCNRTDQLYRQFLTWGYNKLISFYFGIKVRDADSGFRILKQDIARKVFNEEWVNKDLIASEITLRVIYSGVPVKEVTIFYNQREGESRGLPLKRIPSVIFRVLNNFSRLKRTLLDSSYKKSYKYFGSS